MSVSPYASLTFYLNDYGEKANKVMPLEEFERYAVKASAEIDRYTFGRIEECTERISMCCCELAELLYRCESTESQSPMISSESVGGYSVSFNDAQAVNKEKSREKRRILKRWLPSELLYRG